MKECHDELEGIDSQLSNRFREEVVSDRKKSSVIRDRLKAEHEKKFRPYSSVELNEGLAEARLLGPKAEEEFALVVKMMGEDIEIDDVLHRLKLKHVSQQKHEDVFFWGYDITMNSDGMFEVLGKVNRYEGPENTPRLTLRKSTSGVFEGSRPT